MIIIEEEEEEKLKPIYLYYLESLKPRFVHK